MNQAINFISSLNSHFELPSHEPIKSEVTNHEGTKHFKVYVYFMGIKKRCRKSEKHSMFISYIDYNNGDYDQEAISKLASDFLASNVKLIDHRYTVTVSLDYVSRSFDRGFQTELWQPFSKLNKKFILELVKQVSI